MWVWLLCVAALALSSVSAAGAGAARLVCYVENGGTDFSECTHLIYTGDARGDKLEVVLKDYKKYNLGVKIILRVTDADKDLRSLFKSKNVQGLEIYEAHKSLNRTKVLDTVQAARAAITASGGGPLFLALPAHPELLAKYYDLRSLVKKVDLMTVQTHALGVVKKMTYHPSRLSGLWDMMNTDSVVDLVVGLGVPPSKIVISLPATVRKFTLANETLSTPGSPTEEDDPKEIDQAELCRLLQKGRWTLERDQDLSAPYAFKDKTWLSFEDASSVDVKGKYARVRGLGGLALERAERDSDTACGHSLRSTLQKVLSQQSRAPRAAVLRSLEHEILSAPGHARAMDALQVSPYRITQVVDSDGVIHSIREDTRTEFSCSRQGYFVHPRSCGRFYRCVKFDQLSSEYTVFEFDCPAGLAFDSRYEVCVWPGSLPDSQPCPGSSEIAPVPRTRFICPDKEGYYADPENCRWFFACLDHGKAPLTAYEFRCPFGLGFDADKLKCDWPWLVPACGNIARYEAEAFGYSGAALSGTTGFHGQTADAVNIAAHQSLVSGAALDNLVGIQNGFLTKDDALDSNFIASQELANGFGSQGHQIDHNSQGLNNYAYQVGSPTSLGNNIGLVQATKYSKEPKYTSGSLILDDYRLPTKHQAATLSRHGLDELSQGGQAFAQHIQGTGHTASYTTGADFSDNTGAYVHDPSGDYAEPYRHVESPVVPYIHDYPGYKQTDSYNDNGRYSTSQISYEGNNGQYHHDNSGNYDYGSFGNTGSYKDYSGSYYVDNNLGKYQAGVYRADGHIGDGKIKNVFDAQYNGIYSSGNVGNYVSDAKAYTGSSHTLTNGAINVGLVGKTTLVDAGYTDQGNYKGFGTGTTQSLRHDYNVADHTFHNGHVPVVPQPAVSINHIGTDGNNLDGYTVQTTPTASVIPTTATPFASTTAVYNYKTTFVPEAPKSNIKQIFGVSQPDLTYVTPAVITVKQGNVQVSDHSSGFSSGTTGYDYPTPNIKFEEGVIQTTQRPIVVSTFRPKGFSHSHETVHQVDAGYHYSTLQPVTEEPFKKIVAYTTGPSVSFATPTEAPYTPQSYSHQTIHNVENSQSYDAGFGSTAKYDQLNTVFHQKTAQPAILYNQETLVDASQVKFSENSESGYKYDKPSSGYVYSKPSIKFEEVPQNIGYSTVSPTVPTNKPHSYSHQTFHKVESKGYAPSSTVAPSYELTYEQPAVTNYENPILKYTERVTPVQPPSKPYSHQTIHKIETSNIYNPSVDAVGYSYQTPKTVVQYTTPHSTVVNKYQPHSFSHQTYHQVDANKVNAFIQDNSGYQYEQPTFKFEEIPKRVVQYTTAAPVVSTYRPHSYSHQTLHKVETGNVKTFEQETDAGYKYERPAVKFEETPQVVQYTVPTSTVSYQPQSHSYSHQTIHKAESNINTESQESRYKYDQPSIKVEVTPQVVQYSTSAPTAAQNSHSYSHQTVHKIESNGKTYSEAQDNSYSYEQPSVTFQETPQIIQYSTPSTPAPQNSHSYSHQTLHKIESNENAFSQENGYNYEQPAIKFEQRPQVLQYTTAAPRVFTYKPQSYNHQTYHKVESTDSGYKYEQPTVKLGESPEIVEYSTASPASPHSYSHQTYHKYDTVSSTPKAVENYRQSSVTIYQNPILEFTQKVTPTASVYAQPINQQKHEVNHIINQPVQYETSQQNSKLSQGYTYSQPEIQRDFETQSGAKTYSDATLVSHQYYQQTNTQQENAGKKVVFVSTTPATLAYEEHYTEYELPKIQQYQAPEYVPPKVKLQKPSTGSPVIYENYYSQSPAQESYSQEKKIGSIHFSSIPEIQAEHREEYVNPVVSTFAPVVSSTYKPYVYSTTAKSEYLPPAIYTAQDYLPPKEESYLPTSTTTKSVTTTQAPVYLPPSTQASEYLPPQEPGVVNFESYGLKSDEQLNIQYNPHQQYTITSTEAFAKKQNIVVEKKKSNLLGFGTVGPDAGLVSHVTYTTSAPVISSTYAPKIEISSQTPARRIRPKYKSTTQAPYIDSTTSYTAPEYLPPAGELDNNYETNSFGLKTYTQDTKYNPYQEQVVVSTENIVPKKQNLVVETSKSQLLGFGTVGPEAGLVSTAYTTAAPSSEGYLSTQRITSTYAPIKQKFVEVTRVPVRKTKPKVAVVTKINDFNPLIVRKLGAVCSCQSPVLILKGKRPGTYMQQDYDDYTNGNDYDDYGRGDISEISEGQWAKKTTRLQTPLKTTKTVVTSTFNPIIVPDDSYYQDLPNEEEIINVKVTPKPKHVYEEEYISSTPIVAPTTEKVVKIRPRVKTVTVAPTYKTVLLNQEATPTPNAKGASIESQSFNRYGPGGWRSRTETLQGSVDCQRAGLFRHPTQCNKFYACRWDEHKNKFTLHVFNCPVQLSFDPNLGACNWPSQGPACQGDTLLTNNV